MLDTHIFCATFAHCILGTEMAFWWQDLCIDVEMFDFLDLVGNGTVLYVISHCYYLMIWRWWSMKTWSGKNHPVKKKHNNFWKVCLPLSLSLCFIPFSSPLFSYYITLVILSTWIADYSGGHAATVGSVLVTNLKTGFRKGVWDRVEVPYTSIPCESFSNYWWGFFSF